MERIELPITVWENHTDDISCSTQEVVYLIVDEGLLFIEKSDDETEPYIEVSIADLLGAIKQASGAIAGAASVK